MRHNSPRPQRIELSAIELARLIMERPVKRRFTNQSDDFDIVCTDSMLSVISNLCKLSNNGKI